MPAGRPTAYKEEYPEQARKLCLLGATDKKLADFFEVSESTLNKWKLDFPEFSESIREGKQKADAEVASGFFERAIGATWREERAFKVKIGPHEERVEVVEVQCAAPPDTQACLGWLKNRDPSNWREKSTVENTGDMTMRIRWDDLEADA